MQKPVEQLLGAFKKYADPANQIEVPIQPIAHPALRMAALGVAGACLFIGIPMAVALPIVPVSPFALIGFLLMARASTRFRHWLLQQRAYRIAVTVIYTRTDWPFRLLRACLGSLSGQT